MKEAYRGMEAAVILLLGYLAPVVLGAEGQCRLYLAKSSIPNSGWGAFSAVDMVPGEEFMEELVVPVIHHDSSHPWWLMDEYLWSGDEIDLQWEAHDVLAVLYGLASVANSHPKLHNWEFESPSLGDSVGLHRSKNSGAGAITYATSKSKTTAAVPAGGEIFVNYGEHWHYEKTEAAVLLEEDYMDADKLVHSVDSLFKNNLTEDEETSQVQENLLEDVIDLVEAGIIDEVHGALPRHSLWNVAVDQGTARAALPDSIRSVQWLQENGRCMDNIRPGKSDIPEAGRGGFAARYIAKGKMVAPAPLIHISRQDLELELNDGSKKHQLLLNYCLGHGKSSLLLCPCGTGTAYINHASGSKVNTKLVWSTLSNATWQEWNVSHILEQEHSGLMLEFVATKPIKEGEEILVDYGKDWEEAWSKHAADWAPSEDSTKYQSARDMDSIHNERLLTIKEQEAEELYPSNVFLLCRYDFLDTDDNGPTEPPFVYDAAKHQDATWRPCDVVSRSEDDLFYEVVLVNHPLMPPSDQVLPGVYIKEVPRSAIRFADEPYTTDVFLDQAFRHEIHIPDEIFPKNWLDLA